MALPLAIAAITDARFGEATKTVSILMSFLKTPKLAYALAARVAMSTLLIMWIGPATREAARIARPDTATERG